MGWPAAYLLSEEQPNRSLKFQSVEPNSRFDFAASEHNSRIFCGFWPGSLPLPGRVGRGHRIKHCELDTRSAPPGNFKPNASQSNRLFGSTDWNFRDRFGCASDNKYAAGKHCAATGGPGSAYDRIDPTEDSKCRKQTSQQDQSRKRSFFNFAKLPR